MVIPILSGKCCCCKYFHARCLRIMKYIFNLRELSIKDRTELAKTENNKGELDRKVKKDVNENEKDREIVQLEREQLYAENASGNSREIKNDI